jgi:hypothetical protein
MIMLKGLENHGGMQGLKYFGGKHIKSWKYEMSRNNLTHSHREALGSENDVCSRNLLFAELVEGHSKANTDNFFPSTQIHSEYTCLHEGIHSSNVSHVILGLGVLGLFREKNLHNNLVP